MSKKVIPVLPLKHRTEDFQKIDSLFYLTDQHNLRVLSFEQVGDEWRINYLNTSLQREPQPDECRDAQDYDLRMAIWLRACTVHSKLYPKFEDMIAGEIQRLNELTL